MRKDAWTRRSVLRLGAAAAATPPLALAVHPLTAETATPTTGVARDALPMAGVNLAGAEFGHGGPGVLGRDYIYPPLDMVSAYADLGFTSIRLPFRWERLQPQVYGPFNEAEWEQIDTVARHAAARGLTVVLDVHNYAKRGVSEDDFDQKHIIGSPQAPSHAFATFWSTIATRTKDDERIIYGLMNEPVDIHAVDWLPIVNEAIKEIRTAGARNMIMVPGVAFTGAHSWYKYFNTVMAGVDDPDDNLAIEVHQYMDDNSSGTSGDSVSSSIGSARIEEFQEWARARGFKAFLGEFGAGANPTSVAALEDVATEMASAPDVWLGWTAWAGGPWWGDDYPLKLERGADGVWPPQTLALRRYASKSLHIDSRTADSVIDVDFARNQARGVETPAEAVVTQRGSAERALRRNGLLASFSGDAPKITDLGLRIDGRGENMLDAFSLEAAGVLAGGIPLDIKSPTGEPGAYGFGEWMREIELSASGSFTEGDFATFTIHAHVDPRVGLEVVAVFDGEVAMFDMGTMQAHSVSGGAWASMSRSGEWRQLQATWRARRRPNIRLRVRRPARPERWEGAIDGPAVVAFSSASLERGDVSGPFVGTERTADRVALARPLQDLMRTGEATLMVETRSLTPAPTALPILSLGDTLLLGRTPEGALETKLGDGGVTGRRPLWVWGMRHRSAIALSARRRTATIATSGEAARTIRLDAALDGDALAAPLTLGAHGDRSLFGSVTRITAFEDALDGETLANVVA